MTVAVSKSVSKKLGEISRVLHMRQDEIVNRALLVYLDNIEKYAELKKEFQLWDQLSDEALYNFEKKLNEKR